MSFMPGDLLLLLLLLLWRVCFADLWYTQHMFPAGVHNMYSENDMCGKKCVVQFNREGQDDALFQSSAILPLLSSSCPALHCFFRAQASPARQSGKRQER